MRNGFVVCAALVAAGCLTRSAPPKLANLTPVAVAYVMDDEHTGAVGPAPPAFMQAVAKALLESNLDAQPVPFQTFADAIKGRRDTPSRFQKLSQLAGDAPYVLLVETKATFFSQLNGRYRWEVTAKASAARKGGETDPVSNELDAPALLEYDHERAPDALGYAAPQLAERIASLFTGLLGQVAAARTDAMYFVMVDRFANGDASNDGAVNLKDPAAFHGGDLQGVLDRLDWLQGLGVKTVWLSPVFQMRTQPFFGFGAFHGYWTHDLTKLEPRFGDERVLAKLSEELHRRGMRLVFDLVVNHVGMEAPLTRSHPQWFHGKGPLKNWNDAQELTTHDVHGLPDLAQERPEVYAHLKAAATGWMARAKLDGFRMDAVKHVPLTFWSRFNAELKAQGGPGFLVLGEMLDGDPKVLSRWQRDGAFGAMFDFPLYYALIDVFCRDQAPLKLGAVFSSDRLYADPHTLVTLLDNHDLPRVMSDCRGDVERVKQALAVQLTARGVPCLTYGTEVGLSGAKEPENRGDMRFDDAHPLRAHIAKLLQVRAASPALTQGAVRVLRADKGFFAYARLAPEQVAVIAVNQRASPASLTLPPELVGGVVREALRDRVLDGSVLAVEGRSTLVALISPPAPGGFAQAAAAAKAQWREGGRKRAVEVAVRGAPVGQGEQLFLVGSGPELGAWDPARALGPLDGGGRLRASLPVGSAFELKLVVRRADGSVRWEEGENRTLFVEESAAPLPMSLTWQST